MPLVYSSTDLSQDLGTDFGNYISGVAEETLTERFNRLTSGFSDTEVASIMGMTEGAVRKIRKGDTQSFDLHRALRLCDRLGIDPWYLALGRERAIQPGSYDQGGALQSLEGQVAQHDRDLLEIAKTQKTILETLRVLQGAQPKRRSQ